MNKVLNIYKDLVKHPFGRITFEEYWVALFFITLKLFIIIFFFYEQNKILFWFIASPLWVFMQLIHINRYHDSAHNGFWIFVPIANFVLLFFHSTEDNKWGKKKID